MFQFTHSIFSHFKLSNKRINFTFHVREKKEYSKIILFIYFYSISFPPLKRDLSTVKENLPPIVLFLIFASLILHHRLANVNL